MKTRIRDLRVSHHITQEHLALKTGISQANLSRMECGLTIPDASDLICLSDFFQVSVDYILCLTDQPVISYRPSSHTSRHSGFFEKEIRLLQGLHPSQRPHLKNFLESLQTYY